MNNIIIKCIVYNDINIYNYKVNIYDSNNILLYSDYTDSDGICNLYYLDRGIYLIKILYLDRCILIKNIYIYNYNIFNFYFRKIIFISNLVSFKLVDKYYDNLFIEGEVRLCLKHII